MSDETNDVSIEKTAENDIPLIHLTSEQVTMIGGILTLGIQLHNSGAMIRLDPKVFSKSKINHLRLTMMEYAKAVEAFEAATAPPILAITP